MAFGLGKKHSADDDIKKLSRSELLEMLIEQTRLADRLRTRNKKLTKELAVCKANLEKAASLRLIIARLERIERLSAAHAGLTEEEIAELLAMGRRKKKVPEEEQSQQAEEAAEFTEESAEEVAAAEAEEIEETEEFEEETEDSEDEIPEEEAD